jgi:uncharacterized protein
VDVPLATADRPRDRAGMALLSLDECERLLVAHYVGRLAVVIDGHPRIYPMNYRYHDGMLVLRTGPGSKLRGLSTGAPVAFEIDGLDDTFQRGWSVVVEGPAEIVPHWELEQELRRRPLRPWVDGERDHWVRVRPAAVSGRVI